MYVKNNKLHELTNSTKLTFICTKKKYIYTYILHILKNFRIAPVQLCETVAELNETLNKLLILQTKMFLIKRIK